MREGNRVWLGPMFWLHCLGEKSAQVELLDGTRAHYLEADAGKPVMKGTFQASKLIQPVWKASSGRVSL